MKILFHSVAVVRLCHLNLAGLFKQVLFCCCCFLADIQLTSALNLMRMSAKIHKIRLFTLILKKSIFGYDFISSITRSDVNGQLFSLLRLS